MSPTILAAFLLPAMQAWVPVSDHAYHEPAAATLARYQAFAEDVAAVVLEAPDAALPFGGERRHELSAALLVSIAGYESSFREDVEDCTIGGDHDKAGVAHAWGPWQTHRPKADVCAGRRPAARIALAMVTESFKACRASAVDDRLGLYTDGPAIFIGGKCRPEWWRSRSRVARARAWVSAHPLETIVAGDPS